MEPPSDREAELGVIGCCLVGGSETACDALDSIPTDCFASEDTKLAYEAIRAVLGDGKAVDEINLRHQWHTSFRGVPFPPAISQAQDDVPCSDLGIYRDRILDASVRRRLFWSAHEILSGVQDRSTTVQQCLSAAEAKLFDSAPNLPKSHKASECMRMMIEDIERRHRLNGARSGIVTGLLDLDDMLDGLQPGEQTIIAARPSMGKTALGLTILRRACLEDGVPSLFVTLEMGIKPVMRRLAAMHCGINMRDLRRGNLTEGMFASLTTFSAGKSKAPLHIIDAVNGATDTEIGSAIRRGVRLHGIKLVVVDYLQKIRPSSKHEKKTYEIAQASGTLKNVADKCGVAMVTLAQLNRESEKNQVPRLSDLAESSQIERDADVVCLLNRDKTDASKPAELIIAKNRDGELGMVKLSFLGQFCRFDNATREQLDAD